MRFSVVQILGKNVRIEQDPDLDFDQKHTEPTEPDPDVDSDPEPNPQLCFQHYRIYILSCGTVAKEIIFTRCGQIHCRFNTSV